MTKPEQLMFLRREVQREYVSFCWDTPYQRQMCVAYFLLAKCEIMFRLDGWTANSDRLDCKLAQNTAGVERGTSVQFETLKMMETDLTIGKGTEIHLHVHNGRVNFCPPRKISNMCQMSP